MFFLKHEIQVTIDFPIKRKVILSIVSLKNKTISFGLKFNHIFHLKKLPIFSTTPLKFVCKSSKLSMKYILYVLLVKNNVLQFKAEKYI